MEQFLTNYVAVILVVISLTGLFTFLFLTIRKTERERKNWVKTVKLNDMCMVSTVSNEFLDNVKIVEMDDEYVVVETKVRKRWIYPPRKK